MVFRAVEHLEHLWDKEVYLPSLPQSYTDDFYLKFIFRISYRLGPILVVQTIYAKWSQWLQERCTKKFKKLHLPTTILRKTKFQRSKRTCCRFKRKTPSPTTTGNLEESPTVINLSGVALDNKTKLIYYQGVFPFAPPLGKPIMM